jgi:hypothetical protein
MPIVQVPSATNPNVLQDVNVVQRPTVAPTVPPPALNGKPVAKQPQAVEHATNDSRCPACN